MNGGVAFNTFYPAVIATVLLFGVGPGAVATVLSAVCAVYFFLPESAAADLGSAAAAPESAAPALKGGRVQLSLVYPPVVVLSATSLSCVFVSKSPAS